MAAGTVQLQHRRRSMMQSLGRLMKIKGGCEKSPSLRAWFAPHMNGATLPINSSKYLSAAVRAASAESGFAGSYGCPGVSRSRTPSRTMATKTDRPRRRRVFRSAMLCAMRSTLAGTGPPAACSAEPIRQDELDPSCTICCSIVSSIRFKSTRSAPPLSSDRTMPTSGAATASSAFAASPVGRAATRPAAPADRMRPHQRVRPADRRPARRAPADDRSAGGEPAQPQAAGRLRHEAHRRGDGRAFPASAVQPVARRRSGASAQRHANFRVEGAGDPRRHVVL